MCAFKLAWFQPDQFSRAHSSIGSFTGLQWRPESDLSAGFMLSNIVRREPKRNIRVWLSVATISASASVRATTAAAKARWTCLNRLPGCGAPTTRTA